MDMENQTLVLTYKVKTIGYLTSIHVVIDKDRHHVKGKSKGKSMNFAM